MNTILLLAVDPEVHQGFKAQLEKFKLKVHGAYRTSEAQQHLDVAPPSLLLVDLDHIAEPFLGLYQWMIEQPQLVTMPRIFISGRESRDSDVVKILEGASEVLLRKPLQRSQFLHEIKNQLKRRTRSFGDVLTQSLPKHAAATDPRTPAVSAAAQASILPSAQSSGTQSTGVFGDKPKPGTEWLGKQVGSVMMQKIIGRGGMGVVYLGFQSTLNRKVAVKMILPDLINNATMMARFQREALAMARLKSPYVVQVFDAGYTDNGTFFMVMEFLEGKDLEERVRNHGPFDVNTSLQIVEQVLEGLICAHDAGIVHRDLKPSNLIMTDDGHTTVTDFGLAQQEFEPSFTREGAMLGTPYYFPPEQANGEGSDARSDLYSLGIVLYELLTGSVPFPSSNLTEVLYQHAHKPIPNPREKVRSIPDSVVRIVETMAAKRREDRYQDARAALRAVREAKANPQAALTSSGGMNLYASTHETKVPPTHLNLSELPPAPPAPPSAMSSSLQTSRADLSLPIDPEKRLGAFTMSANGSIAAQDGAYSPVWAESMQILQAIIMQLESVAQMGPLNYALCEAESEMLVAMREGQNTQGMVFEINAVPSSIRMFTPQQASMVGGMSTSMVDPLVHLSSTAGVEGLMLLTAEGVQRHHVLPAHINAMAFGSQVSPLAALFSSLSLPLNGIDCCFERGRMLLWKIDRQCLVVLASHKLNKSLLAILLQQQRQLLHNFVPHQNQAFAAGHSLDSSKPHASTHNLKRASFSSQDEESLVIDDSQSSVISGLRESLAASVAPPGGVPDNVMSKSDIASLAKEFARFIGPMAKVLLKKEAKKMGFSSKYIPKPQVDALIQNLAGLLDEGKRQSFLDANLGKYH